LAANNHFSLLAIDQRIKEATLLLGSQLYWPISCSKEFLALLLSPVLATISKHKLYSSRYEPNYRSNTTSGGNTKCVPLLLLHPDW